MFIRSGAIIPMQVDDKETGHGDRGSAGHLTLLVYPSPNGESRRTYHPDPGSALALASRRDGASVTLDVGRRTERYVVRIKEPRAPTVLNVRRNGADAVLPPLASWTQFDRTAEGWFYDSQRRYLWARFATQESEARLSYVSAP